MHKPTPRNLLILLRLWGVVLLGNLIGTAGGAGVYHMPLFDAGTRGAFVNSGREEVMRHTPGEMFANGVPAGWIIATMVWMFPGRRRGENLGDRADDLPVAICDLTHIVVGSVEILYLVFNGAIGWQNSFTVRSADAGGQHHRRHLYLCADKPRADPQRFVRQNQGRASARGKAAPRRGKTVIAVG
ncbi:formate/nitrite transporter family protein [Serratia marcescens]|uniref:Formate/nitrite transporter family protein n=1 Tax=Serratia marcescens TaxID=615 RepID=A0A939NP13_SERMA|nr:formate/nitrite transporter family protein [Serratia marcescens]